MNKEKLAEIVGISFGDGSLTRRGRNGRLRYQLRGDASEDRPYYLQHIIPLFSQITNKLINRDVSTIEDFKRHAFGISIESDKVGKFLLGLGLTAGPKKELKIPQWVKQNKKYLRAFIRGFADTDDSVTFKRNYSAKSKLRKVIRIELSSTSPILVEDVRKSLILLGLHPYFYHYKKKKTNDLDLYKIWIERRTDIKKWMEEIGFNNSKHKTKYLVWGKYGFCPPSTTLAQREEILKKTSNLDKIAGVAESGQTCKSESLSEHMVEGLVP